MIKVIWQNIKFYTKLRAVTSAGTLPLSAQLNRIDGQNGRIIMLLDPVHSQWFNDGKS